MTHIYHNPTSTSQPISGKFYRRPLTKSWLQGWKVIHLSESNHIPVGATESIQRGGNFPPGLQHAFVHAHSQKWAILSQQVGGFSHKKTLKFESKPKNRLESWFIRFTTKIFFLIFSARFSTTEKWIPSQIDLHHCRKSLPPLGYPAMGWKAKDHAGSSALSTWNSMHWQRENTTCRDDVCVKLTIWW